MDKKHLRKMARNMRKQPTFHERIVMQKLSAWGIRFKFQWIIEGWIPDFYLPQYRVILEVDGSQHYTQGGVIRDKFRTATLEARGFRVIRVRNELAELMTREWLLNEASKTFEIEPADRSFHNEYLKTLGA